MAAGLGFKTFTTGEVLTAGDTNGYLMQGVLVFASAAARDAAITSPQEGQTCYLKDTDAVMTYSGSAWVAVGGGSSYVSWTPTFTNITTGNGTKTGSYVKNGKFVSGYAKIAFGSTTSITGTPILTLPSTPENGNISFTSIIADTGTATFVGFGELAGADFYCYVNNASGTYVNTSNISSSVPMTWTTNDTLLISFNYKEN
jgi:hypothetical protein